MYNSLEDINGVALKFDQKTTCYCRIENSDSIKVIFDVILKKPELLQYRSCL